MIWWLCRLRWALCSLWYWPLGLSRAPSAMERFQQEMGFCSVPLFPYNFNFPFVKCVCFWGCSCGKASTQWSWELEITAQVSSTRWSSVKLEHDFPKLWCFPESFSYPVSVATILDLLTFRVSCTFQFLFVSVISSPRDKEIESHYSFFIDSTTSK